MRSRENHGQLATLDVEKLVRGVGLSLCGNNERGENDEQGYDRIG